MTVAVAPALNLSGSRDFDRSRVADLMAVELGYGDGITVIPVSRVLGELAAEGRDAVESPAHARRVAQRVGADAILVFAVTRYDPYDPPSVGITAQLYAARTSGSVGAAAQDEGSEAPRGAGSDQRGDSAAVLAQCSAVYDAAHAYIAQDVREFAASRGAGGSPYGWRKYVVSQRGFLEYCCHATVRALLGGEPYTASVRAETGRY